MSLPQNVNVDFCLLYMLYELQISLGLRKDICRLFKLGIYLLFPEKTNNVCFNVHFKNVYSKCAECILSSLDHRCIILVITIITIMAFATFFFSVER